MKFHKSIRNRMLLGVCGGLGETFGIDPNIIRGVFLLLNLLTRLPLFLIYLLLGFLLPYGEAEHGNREAETSDCGGSSHDYTPDAPPFDVSGAKDVEFDDHEQK